METIEKLSPPLSVSMDSEWFQMNAEHHFWMCARFEEVRLFFPRDLRDKRMLEIGCGNGVFRSQVEKFSGVPVDGCDLNLEALGMAEKGLGRLMLYNILDRNPDLVGKYDVVFLMDVIEHIKNDLEFLEAAIAHLKPGGTIILNVPYGPGFYSLYDRLVGHYRRYTKKQLREIFARLGIEIEVVRCWGFILVPMVLLRKMLVPLISNDKRKVEMGFRMPSLVANQILIWLLRLERLFPQFRFAGASVILVAKNTVRFSARSERVA